MPTVVLTIKDCGSNQYYKLSGRQKVDAYPFKRVGTSNRHQLAMTLAEYRRIKDDLFGQWPQVTHVDVDFVEDQSPEMAALQEEITNLRSQLEKVIEGEEEENESKVETPIDRQAELNSKSVKQLKGIGKPYGVSGDDKEKLIADILAFESQYGS